MRVTWDNESIQTRQFQAAVRVVGSFLVHLPSFDPPSNVDSPHFKLWERLSDRWGLLKEDGDRHPDEYCDRLSQHMKSVEGLGQSVFERIAQDLEKPAKCDQLLLKIAGQAVEDARECVGAWGGPSAMERLTALTLLPVHCETSGSADTRLSFNRGKNENRIVVLAGAHATLLEQSVILHFSFFHEYMSHLFPAWDRDNLSISEGFLFALEFNWFQARNTVFEAELLAKVWEPRLANNRGAFKTGRWLLNRCPDHAHCMESFFLDWVSSWRAHAERLHEDLLSQLTSISTKICSRYGDRLKEQKTQALLQKALCGECSRKVWDLERLTGRLSTILKAYDPPAGTS